MKPRSFTLGLLCLFWATAPLIAENVGGPLVLAADGYLSVPIGANANYFQLGGGLLTDLHYRWADLPLSVGATYDYGWLPNAEPGYFLTIQGFGAVGQAVWPFTPSFALSSRAAAGWFLAASNDSRASQGGNPWFQIGLGVDWRFASDWVVTAAGEVRDRMGLVNDGVVLVSLKYQPSWVGSPSSSAPPPGRPAPARPGFQLLEHEKKGLQVTAYRTDPIVPALLKQYEARSWGQLIIHNYDGSAAEGWTATLESKGYLNGTRELKVPKRLGPGEEVTIEIVAPLTDKVLSLVQSTEIGVTVAVSLNKKDVHSAAISLTARGRNSIVWDDLRRVASFISGRDPGAFALARSALAAAKPSWNPALSPEFQTAVALHSALKTSGLVLRPDPASAFRTGDTSAVDQLQFPVETLLSRTGDSEDLTVLWCSLLEASGLESAVVKVSDQLYPAFAVPGRPEDVQALWGTNDDFIVRDGKSWVPIDPALGAASFSEAWKSAAKKILSQKLFLGFVETRNAWTTQPPVVVPGVAAPSNTKVTADPSPAVDAFVQSEMRPRVDRVLAEKKTSPAALAPQFDNRMGILYARYGFFEQAAEVFKTLAEQNYRSATTNLAHVYLLSSQPKAALDSYQASLKLQNDDRPSLVGLVLAYQALGDQASWKVALQRLSKVDSSLAGNLGTYKPRGGAVRADFVLWKE